MSTATESSELEAALATLTAERDAALRQAAQAIDDVEQFAYAISHDLSEPLRAISGPLSFLDERYKGRLDDEADMWIDFAVDGCARMQSMIADLLLYSRIGRMNAEMQTVDTTMLANDAVSDLRDQISARNAHISIEDLPAVFGCPGELRRVFHNLLANAITFMPAERTPLVTVRAMRDGAVWRFTVSDNGIGIEPRHRERLFGVFKRLHPREEYPGNGMGLAYAKKVVERHGGEIGIDDGPDGIGCTVWFTLPAETMVQDSTGEAVA